MRHVLVALLAVSCAAGAQELDPLATRPGLELGVQGARYEYKEPNLMKLSGNRLGLVAGYTWADESRLFGKLDFRESYGLLKYESNGTGTMDKVPDMILELRALAGLDWVGSSVSLSPYLGLGYRYLINNLMGYSSTGAVGYRRYANYLYAPVGATFRLHMGGGWVLAPTAEYDVFLYGTQVSKLSDTDIPGVMDVTNRQKKGYGWRASLMLEKDHWSFGAWTHYWHIKDSDVQCFTAVSGGVCLAGLEPENITRETGLELRYRF